MTFSQDTKDIVLIPLAWGIVGLFVAAPVLWLVKLWFQYWLG